MLLHLQNKSPSEQVDPQALGTTSASANPHHADGEDAARHKDLLKQPAWGQKENLAPCMGSGAESVQLPAEHLTRGSRTRSPSGPSCLWSGEDNIRDLGCPPHPVQCHMQASCRVGPLTFPGSPLQVPTVHIRGQARLRPMGQTSLYLPDLGQPSPEATARCYLTEHRRKPGSQGARAAWKGSQEWG